MSDSILQKALARLPQGLRDAIPASARANSVELRAYLLAAAEMNWKPEIKKEVTAKIWSALEDVTPLATHTSWSREIRSLVDDPQLIMAAKSLGYEMQDLVANPKLARELIVEAGAGKYKGLIPEPLRARAHEALIAAEALGGDVPEPAQSEPDVPQDPRQLNSLLDTLAAKSVSRDPKNKLTKQEERTYEAALAAREAQREAAEARHYGAPDSGHPAASSARQNGTDLQREINQLAARSISRDPAKRLTAAESARYDSLLQQREVAAGRMEAPPASQSPQYEPMDAALVDQAVAAAGQSNAPTTSNSSEE